MAKHDIVDYEPQAKLLSEKSTLDPKGKRVANRQVYLDMMAHHGVTREVLDSVADAEKPVVAAIIATTCQDLEKKIHTAKEAMESIDNLMARTTVSTLTGEIDVRIKARHDYTDRFNKDNDGNPKVVTKYGDIDVKFDSSKTIPKHVVENTRDTIMKLLGG